MSSKIVFGITAAVASAIGASIGFFMGRTQAQKRIDSVLAEEVLKVTTRFKMENLRLGRDVLNELGVLSERLGNALAAASAESKQEACSVFMAIAKPFLEEGEETRGMQNLLEMHFRVEPMVEPLSSTEDPITTANSVH